MEMIELEGLKELADLTSSNEDQSQFVDLDVSKVFPREGQPRKKFDHQSQIELENSIVKNGLLQPIVVRYVNSNYEIIAGERRWRAFTHLGKKRIPAHVVSLDDRGVVIASIIENVQRDDLNPVEKAVSYLSLINEHHLTHEQVAEVVGKSRASITNCLRLLDLNQSAIKLLENGDLEMGHARALLALENHVQPEIANIVIEKQFSVRQAEALVRKVLDDEKKGIECDNSGVDANFVVMEQFKSKLKDKYGKKAKLAMEKNGCVKVTLIFNNMENLVDLLL